ncbi:MAG: ABC transporter substrate-binding protein [Schleiferiaceae bacterium]|nr:ABC transporter substrate-binding protein [Schleiferiaceae bacterium]
MTTLKVALDWTPNINHIGFLVAVELGFYKEQGINLQLINPLDDNYITTPGKKLERGEVDFAIAPFETVISLNNKTNRVNAVAIYAILQEDLSSIATLKSAKITAPKFLDGKVYASYKARYEDHIVKQLICNDGGKGAIDLIYPEKLGIWHTLVSGKADATWIFDNWEGCDAQVKNAELNTFKLRDFDIPYGYSPIILAKKENIAANRAVYASFVKATRAGFLSVSQNPAQAKTILQGYLSTADKNNIDIEQAIYMTIPSFGNADTCGIMDKKRVAAFVNWLVANKLEGDQILEQNLFTNELFE